MKLNELKALGLTEYKRTETHVLFSHELYQVLFTEKDGEYEPVGADSHKLTTIQNIKLGEDYRKKNKL